MAFNQCVLPILTHGAYTWRLIKDLEGNLRSVRRRMKWKILGITRRNRKWASWIREQTKLQGILVTMKKKKRVCAGRVMRRANNKWTTKVTEWQPTNWGRGQGRQKPRWRGKIRAFPWAGWCGLDHGVRIGHTGNGYGEEENVGRGLYIVEV